MMDSLIELLQSTGLYQIQWDQAAMIVIGLLLYLAIVKKFEPLLWCPLASAESLPIFQVSTSLLAMASCIALFHGYRFGLFPLLIFMGVGAMTGFRSAPCQSADLVLGCGRSVRNFCDALGALVLTDVGIFDFTIAEAAAIGIIGGADGPTAIYVAGQLAPHC